jgi:maltooligosyltrehalose synthase
MTPPVATYRLQLGPNLSFDAAARLAPYLAALGISHCSASAEYFRRLQELTGPVYVVAEKILAPNERWPAAGAR